MKSQPRTVVLLAPQRFAPSLSAVVADLSITGSVATITAGWQERESDDRELDEHLGGGTVNLRLYARTESVFQRDPELHSAHRRRQEDLRQLQELYRLRLGPLAQSLAMLLARPGESRFLEPEREEAVMALRTLDARHLARVDEINLEFDRRLRPAERDTLAREREEVRVALASTACLCIAGGHVAVLLNRLRLFDIASVALRQPLIAWSAGAMCLSERVILFHDQPPQGPGVAEVLESGLGLAPGVVPLPHARRRLLLEDRIRVAGFARRFAPAACLPMDTGARAQWSGRHWRAPGGTLMLGGSGELVAAEGPAA